MEVVEMSKSSNNNSQAGTQANAIAALERAREKGYITEKQFSESLANLTSNPSGGKRKTEWDELESFPVRVTEQGTNVVRATKRISKSGTVTFGVSLGVDGDNPITKRFIPLVDIDNTVMGIRAMQKVAKQAEKDE
jgi:hypothetical protein